MYAVIETGGQQYKVSEGETLKVEKLDGDVGATVELDKVLFVRTDSEIKVGSPYVPGAKVKCEIVGQERGKKVVVFKFKRRIGYRKKRGHRQHYTRLKIAQIMP